MKTWKIRGIFLRYLISQGKFSVSMHTEFLSFVNNLHGDDFYLDLLTLSIVYVGYLSESLFEKNALIECNL